MMWKRFVPLCCVVLLSVLALAPLAQSAEGSSDQGAAAVCAVDSDGPAVDPLTDSDREILRAAEQASDPGLSDLRGGHAGLIVVVLVIILIVVLVN